MTTTLTRLQETAHDYHWASLQATRTVLSVNHQYNIENQPTEKQYRQGAKHFRVQSCLNYDPGDSWV